MRVGSLLTAQPGHLGLHRPMVNGTRLNKPGTQWPLHHFPTTALGGRLGKAIGRDHLQQQKWNLSEEGWQGGNQPAEWRTWVRQKRDLTPVKGRSLSISVAFLMAVMGVLFCLWTPAMSLPAVTGHFRQIAIWLAPLCSTTVHWTVSGTPGQLLSRPGEGALAPHCMQVPNVQTSRVDVSTQPFLNGF